MLGRSLFTGIIFDTLKRKSGNVRGIYVETSREANLIGSNRFAWMELADLSSVEVADVEQSKATSARARSASVRIATTPDMWWPNITTIMLTRPPAPSTLTALCIASPQYDIDPYLNKVIKLICKILDFCERPFNSTVTTNHNNSLLIVFDLLLTCCISFIVQ